MLFICFPSHLRQHQMYGFGYKMFFFSCCIIIYSITKLHPEGLSKEVGDIKHNELLMLKHLILLHPSPLLLTRRYRLFKLSHLFAWYWLFFCLVLTETKYSGTFNLESKQYLQIWSRFSPPISHIFTILSLETMSSWAKHISLTSSVITPFRLQRYPEICSTVTLNIWHTGVSVP